MLNLTKVVRIGTGKVIEAVVTEGGQVWKPEYLKKDGGIPKNRYTSERIVEEGWVTLYCYAPYDPQRERLAQPIRDHIAGLRAQMEEAEQGLLALYEIKKGG